MCSIESKKTFDYLKILRKFIFEEEEEITEVQKKEFEEALGKENSKTSILPLPATYSKICIFVLKYLRG